MLYFIALILIILGLLTKRSKLSYLLIISFLIGLWLAGNTENDDRYAYMSNYYALSNGMIGWDFEFGFQLLNKVGIFLKLSYNQFLFCLVLMGLCLITNTIKSFTSNISYVLSLYFIFPFIIDTVQIRNFLAMSIVIYGFKYIISIDKHYIKYIFWVIMASTIHITSLFYLCVLLVALKNSKKTMKIVIVLSGLSVLFLPIILHFIQIFIAEEKINAYLNTETSLFTKIGVVLYFLLSISLVFFSRKFLENDSHNDDIKLSKSKKKKILEIDAAAILKINIICLLTLFFVMINLNFFRIYRNIYIINYILFGITLSKLKKSNKYYLFFFIVLLFVSISFLIFIIFIPTTNIFKPLFNFNF